MNHYIRDLLKHHHYIVHEENVSLHNQCPSIETITSLFTFLLMFLLQYLKIQVLVMLIYDSITRTTLTSHKTFHTNIEIVINNSNMTFSRRYMVVGSIWYCCSSRQAAVSVVIIIVYNNDRAARPKSAQCSQSAAAACVRPSVYRSDFFFFFDTTFVFDIQYICQWIYKAFYHS